jgi:anti-sigma B factor antagonist
MGQEESAIEVEYGINVTFVTFTAERIVDEQQIRQLHDAFQEVMERNQSNRLILNFVNVQFMTSALLGLLVRIHKKVCELGGHLQLSNLDPNLRRVFEITQLTKVFDIT